MAEVHWAAQQPHDIAYIDVNLGGPVDEIGKDFRNLFERAFPPAGFGRWDPPPTYCGYRQAT